MLSFEVFANNTNLTFLYKIDIKGFKRSQQKMNRLKWELSSRLTIIGFEV